MDKLKPALGQWVKGDRFWGRETEIALFVQYLDGGASILLSALRRMGKTSLMHEVGDRIADRFICLHVDLQKGYTPADAIVEFSLATQPHQDLWGKTKGLFGNLLDTMANRVEQFQHDDFAISLRAGLNDGNWAAKGDHLFDVLAAADKPVVIFIDEISILVYRILRGADGKLTREGAKNADLFLSWLRENIAKHRGKIHLVLTGSIGLEPVLHQAGLSATVNNLMPFELMPWDETTAVSCLRALANEADIVFQEGVCERMVQRIGCCIPHHVQMYFEQANTFCAYGGCRVVTSDDAERLYNEGMLGARGQKELAHYEERLSMVLDPNTARLAKDLLTEASVTGCLTATAMKTVYAEHHSSEGMGEDSIADLLHILEHDGYLKRTAGGYVFVSNLVRDWWKGHFGFTYIPVSER